MARRKSQPSSRRQQARSPHRSTRGLRILLVIALALLVFLVLRQMPPGALILGCIVLLCLFFLVLACWFWLRWRLTPDEQRAYEEQQLEAVRMEETAQMMGVRPVERQDLLRLHHKEFEYFVGDLLETMGVMHDWECVGKSRDHGVDLRGKNQYNLPIVVQCKRFKYKVTPDKTREFGWTLSLHQANEAWFVTTSFFTEQAEQDVHPLTFPGHMKLVDGNKLVDFIRDHWHDLPAHWQWRLTECIQQRT